MLRLKQSIANKELRGSAINTDLRAATVDDLLNMPNVLMYFIKTTAELGCEGRNANFLVFFSKVCQFNGKGISVNQETLYKFLNLRELRAFYNALL